MLETYIFADASEQAIAASAYLRTIDTEGTTHVGFLMGKTKLSPQNGTTIPRLELCAAVLASELGTIVAENMNILPESIKYFSDSKVVLGYLNNVTRRFHTYVSNRVSRILKTSSSEQWSFVPTHMNPADCGTRFINTIDLKESAWLCGPKWLAKNPDQGFAQDQSFPLVDPELDKEIRTEVKTMNTSVSSSIISCFEKYSNWKKLVTSIAFLQHIANSFHQTSDTQSSQCKGWHRCEIYKSPDSFAQAELFILKETQKEVFGDEIECLRKGHKLSKQSSIISLSPFLDSLGLLRVGGRLSKGFLPQGEINPIIIPKNTHIANLLIERFHTSIKHQGRLLTEGALRRAGFWLIGAKRLVSSYIQKCVICRKLRGKLQTQKMADLPADRLTPGPPFTCVGVDTFGPWNVLTRKTRGGSANSKRWALVFTCLTTRAIHIEVIETLSSSSFINALRRFQSLRGPVKVYRSDCGTNFKGATDDLNIEAINVQDKAVKAFLCDSGSIWKFNPPHSSHMGGVWERMIGLTRKILDGIILTSSMKTLTHESLTTFMAEVVAIINSRPIAQISSDPENPLILSPSMLLTGKEEYLPVLSESFDLKDMYRAQWKHVQVMSDIFWKRWKNDYLHSLQSRQKWMIQNDNLKIGDVVLLREKSLHRGEWPLGIISEVFPSDDNIVRKVSVRIHRDGKTVKYIRPISELVLLVD